MSHSKRNTSLAFFTSHERASLKSSWGSQSSRLTSDSFLPFGSCQLCLLRAVDPVACPSGDLFCRECAMTNLLAQRKEIKRLEKAASRRKDDEQDLQAREDAAAHIRAVQDFEAVQMGLEVKTGSSAANTIAGREDGKTPVDQANEDAQPNDPTKRGTKRKFALDETELLRIASEERLRAKLSLEQERQAKKPHLPSFWVPSQTPDTNHQSAVAMQRNPVCPASDPTKSHALSLKSLTSVRFTEEKAEVGGKPIWTCPSCKKTLTNSTKAMLAIPCGHVLCKPCVDKFLKPELRHHRHAHEEGPEPETIACYVCDAELSTVEEVSGKDKDKGKDGKKHKTKGLKPCLVEIRSEGTGFAGGGKNMVKKEGVAFSV